MSTRSDAPAPLSTWSTLRIPLFRALWIATVASNIGTWMHDVGAGWLMTSLAPSPLMVALVQAATTLPVFLLAFPAGALADVVDRRRYLIATQCWMLMVAAALGALTLSGLINAGWLLALTFALGVGTALMMPAWAALYPDVVPRDHLQSAVALNSMGMNVSRAIGPALAGVIVAASGPGMVFALNALSFLGVIAVLWSWKRAPRASHLPAERFLGALRAGFRYVRHAPPLQRVLVRGAAFFVFASATWAFLPLVARQELSGGAALYGWLVACIGVGAVAGAVVLPKIRARVSRDRMVAGATVVFAACAVALAFVRDVPALSVAMLAAGAAWIAAMSSFQMAAQMALPDWVRARGLAAFMVVFMGGMAAGSALWGQAAEWLGIPWALTLAAAGALLGVAATWRVGIGGHDRLDLTPSVHWPPLVTSGAEGRGPVLVLIEYRVDAADAAAFVAEMSELARARRRDGAYVWGLFRDTDDPARFIEQFQVESWEEHLRQHHRVTHADREVEERANRFHRGDAPPVVTHAIAARPEPDGESGPA
ncbi:MAG: MFS transporter [Pseudomonadota bacterium]